MKDVCRVCEKILDVSQLVKDKSRAKGYRNKCLLCLHESRSSAPYLPRKGRGGSRRTIAWQERKRILDELRAGPCLDCLGEFPAVCMDFDHVRGPKLFGVMSHYRDKTIEQLMAEVEKCEVVCSNCHRIRTAARR